MQHHGYSLTELDNMIPWEGNIFTLLQEHIKRRRKTKKMSQV